MTVVCFPKEPVAPKAEPVAYLRLAETNKILRQHLAKAFPGVKFRVRGESYSGGSSTRIDWVDGPTKEQVERISSAYSSRGFDGMIDMAYSKTSWLLPDGRIVTGWSEGTEGSMGATPGYVVPKPHPQARAVHSGIGYVFAQREISEAFAAGCLAAYQRQTGRDRCDILNKLRLWPDEEITGERLAQLIPAPRARS
ncbi:MAG: hypothetical protein J0I54_17750 [Bosea sp.]|uniref:LPD29 domain-containing protein n=1 Tax=unclassified Bosea (in: a-proteobacteria) TaxID=2653178 RepID=UPI0009608F14|nr:MULTISPECIES: LPD29 domain-containing protein [unclassified Bosea (in: a-proteobacteria)]MBN9458478.1 hypothetical protein [Bosea sp. (in: a-proteobacteria)]OJV06820.1 MAG: hypothetical protein BGO20_00195 [Bosea sp. 67-29]